jgi:hypothetical protein
MSDEPMMDYSEEDAAREAAKPVSAGYTGKPCRRCNRIRVYLRRDGREICEKCETFQDTIPETPDAS